MTKNATENLTKNFSLSEFERSDRAKRMGIDNHVPEALMPNIKRLCENVLQPLRDHAGCPVIVTSGYRNPVLNSATPDSSNKSQHCRGQAADIVPPDGSLKTLLNWIEFIELYLDFDQLIHESKGKSHWIHVSYVSHKENRREVKRLWI